MGQDGHDRGAKVIATAFADIGFDVDIGPLFQTPREVARWQWRTTCTCSASPPWPAATRRLYRKLIAELRALGRDEFWSIAGGVIPPQDYELLSAAGVAGMFGPGTRDSGFRAEAILSELDGAAESAQTLD